MSLASLGSQAGSGREGVGAAWVASGAAAGSGVGLEVAGAAAGGEPEFAAVQANKQTAVAKQVSRIGFCDSLSPTCDG